MRNFLLFPSSFRYSKFSRSTTPQLFFTRIRTKCRNPFNWVLLSIKKTFSSFEYYSPELETSLLFFIFNIPPMPEQPSCINNRVNFRKKESRLLKFYSGLINLKKDLTDIFENQENIDKFQSSFDCS